MSFLDPILGPLLTLPPLPSIAIVSVVISVMITFAYKWLTDQDEMKSLKEDLKKTQQKMKEHKKDPEKLMKMQKEAMDKNMKYMMKSMKPTLFTFIPIILVFGWLNANMAYFPLVENVPFTVTTTYADYVTGDAILLITDGLDFVADTSTKTITDGKVVWTIQGLASEVPYTLSIKAGDALKTKDIIITPSKEVRKYLKPDELYKKDAFKTIVIGNEKIRPLNLFGWRIGWLGTYILFSLVVSVGLRKILNIY